MKRTADLWDSVEILVAVLGDDFRLGIIAKNPDSLVYVVVRLFVQEAVRLSESPTGVKTPVS